MDRSSLSNPSVASVSHLEWTASVCFTTKTVTAKAVYHVEILSSDATSIDLDTSNLLIREVAINGSSPTINFVLSPVIKGKPHLGQKLSIPLPVPLPINAVVKVSIDYETTDGCTALQWLPPAQTAGKTYPYLFSQCQAIHARTLMPCMDCPGVKMTYRASVTVPKWSTAVMSALSCGSVETAEDKITFLFHQPVPIPAYLFAIVVGQLECRDVSPRVKVWSEPTMVEAAAHEFMDTEQFLSIAEEITDIPYVWERYDLLCLVPSFPYGGMENPCLTFVTPTLLAGDRSLAGVIAHEIAHSWTGNLVTNLTWEHFWLNEGWTRWLESKIMTKFCKSHLSPHLDLISANISLKEAVNLLPPEYSRLVPQLGDGDPDDAFSSIPYEKGFQFLFYLENLVGEAAFLKFFQAYLQRFKYSTVTSQQFQDLFCSMFKSVKDIIPWNTWLYQQGMPVVTPSFDDTLARAALDLSSRWVEVDHKFQCNEPFAAHAIMPTEAEGVNNWKTNQTEYFLDDLFSICNQRRRPLHKKTALRLGDKYRFKESKNSEILFRYCKLAIAAGDESVLPVVIRFITTQGRMKYVRPLYRALYESDMGKPLAVGTFLTHRNFYHPIAAKMIAKDLNIDKSSDGKGSVTVKEKKVFIAGTLWVAGIAIVALAVLSLARRKR